MFFLLQNIGLLEEKLEERKQRLQKEKLTVQPFIVCVLDDKETYYIAIDSVRYTFDTPLKALNTTYKAFHTLNARYSPESTHVWSFIQRMVYNMQMPHDNDRPATHSLMIDIKRLL